VAVCEPYFAIEKLANLERPGPTRAIQSSAGIVITGSA
jgi:hypothetical protein